MPVVKIHLDESSGAQRRVAIAEAVQDALSQAFKIPRNDVFAMFHAHPHGGISNKGPAFVFIEILAIAGRSPQAKRELYRLLFDKLNAFESLGPGDVLMMLHEMPADNCGVRGGQMASDIALGFEVKV